MIGYKTVFAAATVAALFCSVMSRQASADLLGYWPLDGDANDLSTFANHGTLAGNASFSANVPAAIGGGSSIRLDGVGDYVDLGNNGGNSGAYNFTTGDWSISGWFAVPDDENWVMYANGGEFSGGVRTVIWRGSNSTNRLQFNIDDDGSTGQEVIQEMDNGEIVTGEWNHVVAMREGDYMKLYTNGILRDIQLINQSDQALDLTGLTQKNAYIGTNKRNDNDEFNHSSVGNFDDLSIYDRALTQQEVWRLYLGSETPLTVETSNQTGLETIAYNDFEGASDVLGYSTQIDIDTDDPDPNQQEIVESPGDYGGTDNYLWFNQIETTTSFREFFHVEFDAVDLRGWDDVEVSLEVNGLPDTDNGNPYEGSDDFFAYIVHNGSGPTEIELIRLEGDGTGEGLEALSGTTWFTAAGLIPDDATTARLVMRLSSNGDDEDFYVNNVLFAGNRVPEPSTIGMAALGIFGLAWAARRG